MDCLICKEHQADVIQLNCGHVYCTDCFTNWYKNNKRVCCYCFFPFNYTDYIEISYSELSDNEFYETLIILLNEDAIEELGKAYLQTESKIVMDTASKYGHLEAIKYLHETLEAKCTTAAMYYASRYGHLEIVKYLHEVVRAECTEYAIDSASCNGHLEVVKYLHTVVGVGCTVDAMDCACENGHLEVVKYLHEVVGVGCTEYAMDYASYYGDLEIVKYLHEVVGLQM